jgi:Fic family protein
MWYNQAMFEPRFQITPAITKDLMAIEADRQVIAQMPLDVEMLRSLRETAKLMTTHFSTQIEGNRLTQVQVAQVIAGGRFPGRERDETEVRFYYKSLQEVERLANESTRITEGVIKRIHGLAFEGKSKVSPYRDGQNIIRDGVAGRIVYMPPEASDVPLLMKELVKWINHNLTSAELPIPLIAALAHYQFATIHPYYDGNGRTARLLATLILHQCGYGLKGIYSLEEYYARNLDGYYHALEVGESHNYYMGRAESDLTNFIAYFCKGMADSFASVRQQAMQAGSRQADDQSDWLSKLDPRERQLVAFLKHEKTASTKQIAEHLGLSPRTVTALSRQWIKKGLLELHNPSKKNRSYRLADQ